jgi:hypothetical protein
VVVIKIAVIIIIDERAVPNTPISQQGSQNQNQVQIKLPRFQASNYFMISGNARLHHLT